MKGLFDRLMGWLGFDLGQKEQMESSPESVNWREPASRGNRDNVVGLPIANRSAKLVVYHPLGFDEVQLIAEHLKNRRAAIINLERTDKDVARRVLDFLSGTVFAVGGNVHRVSVETFVFAPNNFEVNTSGSNQEEKGPGLIELARRTGGE